MNILLFGATGAAGGGVLASCLADANVAEVRAVVRRPLAGAANPKLHVVMHGDFLDYAPIAAAFDDVDACLFCLGISSTQVSGETDYRRITRDFPLAAATLLRARSPRAVFHYISGRGASADSRFMWARVKAEAERDLLRAVDTVCWRPAFIDGARSDSGPKVYQLLRPVFRLLQPFRNLYISGDDLGRAMRWATTTGMRSRIIENAEIRALADTSRGAGSAPLSSRAV